MQQGQMGIGRELLGPGGAGQHCNERHPCATRRFRVHNAISHVDGSGRRNAQATHRLLQSVGRWLECCDVPAADDGVHRVEESLALQHCLDAVRVLARNDPQGQATPAERCQ